MSPPRKIGLIQVFSPDKALEILRGLIQRPPLDLVLLPEYCFDDQRLGEVRTVSAQLPHTGIITALVVPGSDEDIGFRRNRAVIFLGGKASPIYNKFSAERTNFVGDDRPKNREDFFAQPSHCFVSICNDKQVAKQARPPPKVWLIPASDATSESVVVPPLNFTGHILFANGSQRAQRSSYYQQIVSPYSPPTILPVDCEIPLGVEEMQEIEIPELSE